MYQFFVEDEQVQQDRICIVGGDVNHIGHVLRMKTGEKIRISDQSGRSYFCRILEITEEEVWAQIEDTDEMGTEFSHKVYLFHVVLVPYENERGMEATREIFRSIPEGASIGVMIGPEGGFSPEEIAQLDKDMHRISLGRRILRTETAGMATLSMLIYELDI